MLNPGLGMVLISCIADRAWTLHANTGLPIVYLFLMSLMASCGKVSVFILIMGPGD